MGSWPSALRDEPGRGSSSDSSATGLGDLPEACVASILMYLEPRDICRVAKLNRAFRGASSADFVWESKLPSNYLELIDKVFDNCSLSSSLCKKDVYALLCQTNTVDGGNKKIWLDKITGGICMAISAKGLTITGIGDRRYWKQIPCEESRFGSIAYLQQIWWFEVNGEIDFPFPVGSYSMYFRVQLGQTVKRFCQKFCNTEQVHGWDLKPVHFQFSTSDGQRQVSQRFVEGPGKWVHYHAGDFVVKNADEPIKLKFSMTQIDCTHTKGGLCFDSVVIYPTGFKESLKHF